MPTRNQNKNCTNIYIIGSNEKKVEVANETTEALAPEKITEKKKMGRPNKGKSTGKRVNFVLSEEIYNK